MRYLVLPFMLFILSGCQALTTFDKYATLRLYEVYKIDGVSACDYKPKFNECTDGKQVFNLKISDDKSKVALVTYNKYAYFGFTRDDYQRQTQPLRDFLLWVKQPKAKDQKTTMLRKRGNVAGTMFENEEVEYQFDYLHSRSDVQLLVIQPYTNGSSYAMTEAEVRNLLSVLDAWYNGTFTGQKLANVY